jgi:hypothetical protein
MLLGVTKAWAEDFSFALGVVLTPPVVAREALRLVQSARSNGTADLASVGLYSALGSIAQAALTFISIFVWGCGILIERQWPIGYPWRSLVGVLLKGSATIVGKECHVLFRYDDEPVRLQKIGTELEGRWTAAWPEKRA